MKKLLVTTILLFIFTLLFGQDKSIDPLKASAMPASSIIGAQANEISRPKSLKGLETALINNGHSSTGMVLPNSFALELNPFMLGPRKNFNYKIFTRASNDSIWKTMLRNFSFSLSSTQSFSINDSQMTHAMGFGLRTIILNGKPNPQVAKAFELSLENNQLYLAANATVRKRISYYFRQNPNAAVVKDSLISYLNEHRIGMKIPDEIYLQAINTLEILPDFTNATDFLNAFATAFTNDYTAPNFVLLQELLENVKMSRYGWRWDVQAAIGTAYPTNAFSYSVVPRWGAWTNVSYKPLLKNKPRDSGKLGDTHLSNFEFIGMFRWLQNNNRFYREFATQDSTFIAGNFIDIGGRIVYEYKKFSAEAEAIYRINSTTSTIDLVQKNSLKYVFNFNYNMADNIVISYFIGKDFDQANLTHGDLISGLTLNFGFGDFKLSDLASKQ